ncbi:progranulin isoform X2 [Protopterus annectens]|uniref:progranulin isoform X2 n=1 Tax=Protopterus annectens TaxID=7888 RepID=UPI001CF931B2|nr:progranulin isoform X2 [Protopterus annectens]
MVFLKTCILFAGVVVALKCPDGLLCRDEASCCELPGGGYSCCSSQKEVMKPLSMIPSGLVNNITGNACPDNTYCPAEYSCVQLPLGSFGCCPLPEAACCKDVNHCCPKGFRCSKDGKSCIKESDVPKLGAVMCPDEKSECPDFSTCCELPDGSWGCCPYSQAVCCEDKEHCCPERTRCDLKHYRCVSHGRSLQMRHVFPSEEALLQSGKGNMKLDDVPCPNKTNGCPDGTTCCQLRDGHYGCCPFENAVCCNDHEHCCPHGYECDLVKPKCKPLNSQMSVKIAPVTSRVKDVPCDDTSSCPDGSTCCKMASGAWGCCPIPDAVCCEDHEHCCPQGTKCNLPAQTCDDSKGSTSLLTKTAALRKNTKDVPCDDTSSCPDGSTCCKMASGAWGCCPIPDAVCCEDHEHCCPQGTKCNLPAQTCDDSKGSTSLLTKTAALRKNTKDVPCDDTSSCPDGSTCCKTASGSWGCCPIPDAVCCEDHEHCCPQGTKCNLPAQTCDDSKGSTSLLTKTATLRKNAKDVPCDDTSSCPDGSTCCKMASGAWGCCPIPDAVCCEDHEHCCPQGTKCNLPAQTCDDSKGSTSLLTKTAALRKNTQDVVCDETTSCPDGSTCCKMLSGKWGCCPLPRAVCCKDQEHCCPEGTKCNLSAETCDSAQGSTPLYRKIAAITKNRDVACDESTSCSDGSSCCKMLSGAWGCCPFPNAVCCEDKLHCCPKGYSCSMTAGMCVKKGWQHWDVPFSSSRKAFSTL